MQKKIREGEKGPAGKEERIEAYLDRLESIFENSMGFGKEKGDKGGFELLKYKILEKYITKFEEIPESYWKVQEEEARKRGEGGDWGRATPNQKQEVRQKHAEVVLADQRASLEQWLDYFALPDSNYMPKEIKYWVFRNILNLKELVKTETEKPDGSKEEKIEFPKRSKGTVSPFPDLNQEALNYVIDALMKKLKGQNPEFGYDIQPDARKELIELLKKEDFVKLYAWGNEFMSPIPKHLLPITDGKWVKYGQGSDSSKLVETIRGRGTGWCTAGENTAKTQLEGGDFYVYYSLDDDGRPIMPRLAIRMEGQERIAEDPRGIAYKQNLDPYMAPVLEEKLKEFGPVGDAYKKKSKDMRQLTEAENKTKKSEPLTKDDLTFLYEINFPIEGFGYRKDPRIAELRQGRNPEEDMLVIFECERDEIAHVPSQINENTKAYVGQLEPGILGLIQKYNIEHVYTSFPEGKISRDSMEIGGESAKELKDEIKAKMKIYESTEYMMNSKEFQTFKKPEKIELIRLTVKDLGFARGATTEEIYERAQALGLELCPSEVGPHYRLKYTDQPLGEWFLIAMKQISDRNGDPSVFRLVLAGVGLWLSDDLARPDDRWGPGSEFVFRLRKLKS